MSHSLGLIYQSDRWLTGCHELLLTEEEKVKISPRHFEGSVFSELFKMPPSRDRTAAASTLRSYWQQLAAFSHFFICGLQLVFTETKGCRWVMELGLLWLEKKNPAECHQARWLTWFQNWNLSRLQVRGREESERWENVAGQKHIERRRRMLDYIHISNSLTLAFVHTEIHMQNACRSVSFISSLSVRICTLSS